MITRTFYYDSLDQNLLSAYSSLQAAIAARSPSARVSGITNGEDFRKVFIGVSLDHPEYIYFAAIHAELNSNGDAVLPYIDENLFTTKINQAVSVIYDSLGGKTDDYSKVKAIYDYLATHVKYDYDAYEGYRRAANSGDGAQVLEYARTQAFPFTPYAVFTRGVAVCEGIAKAFKILCDLFNVPCACLFCHENNNGQEGAPHMNNLVTINGVDTVVDVTAGLKTDDLPMIRYDYFLVGTEEISRFYIYDHPFNGYMSELNYHKRKGQIFKSAYSLRKFLAGYNAAINNRELRFRYDGDEIKEDEMENFAIRILNKYAPNEKQWVGGYRDGYFNAVLCDSYQIKRIQEAIRKRANA